MVDGDEIPLRQQIYRLICLRMRSRPQHLLVFWVLYECMGVSESRMSAPIPIQP